MLLWLKISATCGGGGWWIYVVVGKIAPTEGPCDLQKCYVVWRPRQVGAQWGGTCLLFVSWNSPQNFGVIAGNRNQVNRKLLRTFLFCVHLASFHWTASVGVLISSQFHFKLQVTLVALRLTQVSSKFPKLVATRRRSPVAVGRQKVSPKFKVCKSVHHHTFK